MEIWQYFLIIVICSSAYFIGAIIGKHTRSEVTYAKSVLKHAGAFFLGAGVVLIAYAVVVPAISLVIGTTCLFIGLLIVGSLQSLN